MNDEQGYDLVVPADGEPVVFADVMKDLIGEKRTAKSLIGKTFNITKGRPFKSSYEGKRQDPWFCVCADSKTGERFHVVLGGDAIVPILQEYAASKPRGPLKVTLNFIEGGGAFEGYYQFS